MRLDPSRGRTAYQVLRSSSEREIADIIFELGEERLSRKIAHRIVEARAQGQLVDSTTQFAELVARAFPPAQRHGRIHPATRTFQALRIFVNEELSELDALLQGVIPSVVSPGGRVAILSFHSLEDRRVKQCFADKGAGIWKPVFKKAIEAGEQEVSENPRARSARLRVAERMES
jgi:16S rRNA (cytosine1402-N4)-methyltransferase